MVVHHSQSFFGLILMLLFVIFISGFRNSSFVLGIRFLVLTRLIDGLSDAIITSIHITISIHTALSVRHLALSMFSDSIVQLEGLPQFFECTND